MTLISSNGPLPNHLAQALSGTLSGISSRYGSTVLGDSSLQPKNVASVLRGEGPRAGSQATSTPSPQDQLTQIVSTFLNSLTEHVVRRVVDELRPLLEAAVQSKPVPSVEYPFVSDWTNFRREQCETFHKIAGGCELFKIRNELEQLKAVGIIDTIGRPHGRHRERNSWDVCDMRIAIDSRLFEVYYRDHQDEEVANGSEVEITEITEARPRSVHGHIGVILNVIEALVRGSSLDEAATEWQLRVEDHYT